MHFNCCTELLLSEDMGRFLYGERRKEIYKQRKGAKVKTGRKKQKTKRQTEGETFVARESRNEEGP